MPYSFEYGLSIQPRRYHKVFDRPTNLFPQDLMSFDPRTLSYADLSFGMLIRASTSPGLNFVFYTLMTAQTTADVARKSDIGSL